MIYIRSSNAGWSVSSATDNTVTSSFLRDNTTSTSIHQALDKFLNLFPDPGDEMVSQHPLPTAYTPPLALTALHGSSHFILTCIEDTHCSFSFFDEETEG